MINALRGSPISLRGDEGLSSSAPPPASIPAAVGEVDPKEDELQKNKGKACMFGDKPTLEILNVSLTRSSSGPILTPAKLRASIIVALQSLPWCSLSSPHLPSSIEGLIEPINTNKSPLPGVPLGADLNGEVIPPTIAHAACPKADTTNDVLTTRANTLGDLVGSMMKDPSTVSGFQR
ncbi:hypothetical protein AMTR_s00081p00147260 [Amborella trichopoda]|uniref:Uncharacterized protein n=1 Tax=Amborella trichopoda TaxID=13333 RepID=W1PBW3_AMBTC|nr:hypothetical protein AMTR_s00081p00147260 [Amborella trichopoda]